MVKRKVQKPQNPETSLAQYYEYVCLSLYWNRDPDLCHKSSFRAPCLNHPPHLRQVSNIILHFGNIYEVACTMLHVFSPNFDKNSGWGSQKDSTLRVYVRFPVHWWQGLSFLYFWAVLYCMLTSMGVAVHPFRRWVARSFLNICHEISLPELFPTTWHCMICTYLKYRFFLRLCGPHLSVLGCTPGNFRLLQHLYVGFVKVSATDFKCHFNLGALHGTGNTLTHPVCSHMFLLSSAVYRENEFKKLGFLSSSSPNVALDHALDKAEHSPDKAFIEVRAAARWRLKWGSMNYLQFSLCLATPLCWTPACCTYDAIV